VVQALPVEKVTVVEVYAESVENAIEAISSGAVDLTSASDDVGNVWAVEHESLESEDYLHA
jgi:hypothetical protein